MLFRSQNTAARTTDFNLTQIATYIGSTDIAFKKSVSSLTSKTGSWNNDQSITNGTYIVSNYPSLYSSEAGANEYVEVDLGAEFDIDKVIIYGRQGLSVQKTDGCQLLLRAGNGDILYRTLLAGAVADIYTIQPAKFTMPGSTILVYSEQVQSTLKDRMNALYSTNTILTDASRQDYMLDRKSTRLNSSH